MAIKVISIEPIHMMQGDLLVTDERFATLLIFHAGNNIASPRVPLSELPEGIQVGDFIKLVKAD